MASSKDNEALLNDIIGNIKATIEKNRLAMSAVDPDVVDLTEVVDSAVVSDNNHNIRKISSSFGRVEADRYLLSDEEISEIFKESLKPYLRSWLNQNIAKITKEVVETEVKKLLEKITV